MIKENLEQYGFSGSYLQESAKFQGYYAGRIISQYRDLYKVVCENGELTAEVSGKFRYETLVLSDFPSVGDFVMLDRTDNTGGNAVIHSVLPRKSLFLRKAAGKTNNEQVVAANIDTVFICLSLNNDFNLRRLERYLAISWDSGAIPVVVLTKSDLCEDISQMLLEAQSVAAGADVLITSSAEKDGYSQVMQYIRKGETIAFIGSSGVGKSSLINRLLGEDKLDTGELRNDDKGRHTTTHRELILLPSGAMVIDTPGMRELGIETADFSKSFADIDELSQKCKFRDCTHKNEPGCAVLNAVEDGTISAERLQSYHKLKKEAKYEGMNSRQLENAKINEIFGSLGAMKSAKRLFKEKNAKRNH